MAVAASAGDQATALVCVSMSTGAISVENTGFDEQASPCSASTKEPRAAAQG